MDRDSTPQTAAPLVVPEIVALPDEIDITNADAVGRELRSACQPGAAVVIADMTQTAHCDSSGVRQLLLAADAAGACGAELRLVIPSAAVWRLLSVLGLDRELKIYPSLGSALTAGPPGSPRQPAS